MRATSSATFGDRDRRASTVATGEETIHLFRSPFWEGHGGVLAGRSGSGTERTNAAVGSHLVEFSEQERRRSGISRSQIAGGDSRHVEKAGFSSTGGSP